MKHIRLILFLNRRMKHLETGFLVIPMMKLKSRFAEQNMFQIDVIFVSAYENALIIDKPNLGISTKYKLLATLLWSQLCSPLSYRNVEEEMWKGDYAWGTR
jgi:hypothetical protein